MTPDITQTVKELAIPLAEEKELFLVDVELKTGSGNELWVYLDGEEKGVNLDECADISRELGFLIDAHELIDGKYRLNVSSPGLSRPLMDERQYPKNVGRTIKLRYKGNEETKKVTGKLSRIDGELLVVEETQGKKVVEVQVPFPSIIEAKIVPQF
ncbi:MAG: ribosome maturation factor RimP [Balneolales bacterium]|nr:ribosome maturation factor RimP [Balneolales bacterium]